ncbi:protein of unknown function [Lutibacter oricola]|uniref:DUF3857 domain-containing protein n=1 Tax=Lutibacter oricola TaxID=762486 RepID=A0A1H2X3Y0_9FLAO|nr:DUF3857 domain-containing protein [Lutibacter oricola]SDW87592.1 protein of unknown function [Lutibacter oricola]
MKKILLIATVLLNTFTYSQNKDYIFGYISPEEVKMQKYPLDTTANAVVLYEQGDTKFKVGDTRILVETVYYCKLKIFNKEGFKHATFKIPTYYNDDTSEKVKDIKAVTTNGYAKTTLSKSQIFTEKTNERWKEVKFTLPNIKEGSIVEVQYTVESPFLFNLNGWEFQSEIPKVRSVYNASIPGVYIYNRKLTGYVSLTENYTSEKRNCFRVPRYTDAYANCEEVTYAAEDIPAFIEEDYMTDPDNFRSKIKFELRETRWFDGSKKRYSKTWEDVDKEFKKDKDIGTQLKKTSFFEDKIPTEITSLPNNLEKAKQIYYFIQKHFSWNKKYRLFNDIRVKSAFEEKTGNISEINISLINSLKAAGFDTELVMLSTRANGFTTKKYPVITDFNYVIAKLNIGDNIYLLDATDKQLPFNMLPYRCLNGDGRVMDFENSSYWIDIKPSKNNRNSLTVALELKEDGIIVGKIRKYYSGYRALERRGEISSKTEDDLIAEFENGFDNLEVINYEISNKENKEKGLIEMFEIEIDFTEDTNIMLSPFFDEKFSQNPFQQKNRLYPVDFGYNRNYSVNFSIELPENYTLDSNPKNCSFSLVENGGKFQVVSRKLNDYRYTLKSNFTLNKPLYYNFEYSGLKEIFNQVIKNQKSMLIIKKKL